MTAKRKHVPFSLPIKNGTAIVHGDPGMSDELRAALTRIAETAATSLARGDFDRPARRKLGPVGRELWRVKDCAIDRLYHWNPRSRRYGILSVMAKQVLHDAALAITGMNVGPNEYWLPQVMSEAIEACEALEL